MTLSNEELMLTLIAKQNATDVFSQVDKSARSMSSNVCSVLSSMNDSMTSFGQIAGNVVQGLTGKSALDNILGTSSKAETNKVLLNNMTETKKGAEELYATVDKVTDSSLTSMQELIPAMKAFKSATGASDKEMTNITDDMANFGAAVLAQTGSTDLAQGAMMDLSKGIKGAFAALDQYGITEDSLKATGYWKGEEDDVKGFMKAVTKVTGSTEELMETNQGLDALIGKSFSRAGKKIGNEILPQLKDLKKGYIELDNQLGGGISASILMVSASLDTANKAFWNFSTAVKGVRDLKDTFSTLNDVLRGTKEAADMANNAMDMGSNISQIGAGAGGAASAGVDIAKATDTGMDAMGTADVLSNLKSKNKYDIEAIKEATQSIKSSERLQKELDATQEAEAKIFDLMGKRDSAQAKIDSGIFGGGMRKQLAKEVQDYNDEIDNIIGKDLWTGIKSNKTSVSKAKAESNTLWKYYEDLFDGQEHAMSNAEKVSSKLGFENKGGINVFRDLAKETSSSKQDARKVLDELDDLKKSQDEIQWSMDYAQSGFIDKLRMRKDKGIKSNFSDLFGNIKSFFKGASETGDILDDAAHISDDVTDAAKDLKNTKNIADATEGVVEGAAAVGAVAPEAAAAGAGVEATAAATTTLTGAFTSMIVPLLAAAAVIAIMIPIAAGLIIEAMLFLNVIQQVFAAMDFGSVDLKDNIKGIKQLAEGLAWIGVAMGAMTFTSIMTGLAVMTGGFLGITGPLQIAIDALTEAEDLLKKFGTVGIDPSVPNNLKNISESLMSVSNAMGALTWTNITTGFSNWISGALGFGSVTDALSQAKDDLIKASTEINTLAGEITPIDEDKAKNIQNVCDSLASVGDAIGALRSIRDGQNWDNLFGGLMEGLFGKGVDIKTALDNVKTDIKDAADALSGWELPDIDEEGKLGEKIKKVSDTLTSVNDAFQTLRGLRDDNNWDDWIGGIFEGSDIKTAIGDVVTDINEAASALSGLSLDNFGEDSTIGDNVKNVSDALTSVSEAATTLTNLPPMDNFDSSQITTAVTNLQTAATELSNINETTFDSESVNSVLTNVQTALENLKTTLSSASGFTETSIGIGTQIVSGVQTGLDPLGPAVQGKVASAIDSAKPTANTYGKGLGFNASEGFKSSLKLADTMTTEMGYVKTAVDNGIAEAKTAAQNGAQEVVEAFKSGINVGSPGDIARAMKGEMNYTKEAILNAYPKLKESAYNAASLIVNSFGNPKLNPDSLFLTNNNPFDIGALETTTSQAPIGDNRKTVIIEVHEGAVSVDARNKTEKEARGIMTLALESLDNITDIDVDV